MNQKIAATLLTATLLLGAFFRLYGIQDQGFFIYDEGAHIYRANYVKAQMSLPFGEQNLDQLIYDTKPVWGLLILASQKAAGNHLVGIQILSALFGIATIPLLYIFGFQVFKSRPIALLSTLYLAIFSYHAFYSRLAMPEAAIGLGALLSIILYIKAIDDKPNYAFGSGAIAGIFLLINYRICLLPIYFLILEGIRLVTGGSQNLKPSMQRYLRFVVSFTALIPAYELALLLLRTFKIAETNSLITTFLSTSKAGLTFDFPSLFTYFYILLTIEGFVFTALLVIGAYLSRKNPLALWLSICILLQMFLGSLSVEKPFRVMSAFLPVMALIVAYGAYTFWNFLKKHSHLKMIPIIVILLSLIQGAVNTWDVANFKSDIPKAVAISKQYFHDAPILTSNVPLIRLSAYPVPIESVSRKTLKDLPHYVKNGYGALVTDPQKYVTATQSGSWNESRLNSLLSPVESHCTPMAEFGHFDKRLLKMFFFEHTGPTLTHTINLINEVGPDAGHLKIYDIHQCFERLRSKKILPVNLISGFSFGVGIISSYHNRVSKFFHIKRS